MTTVTITLPQGFHYVGAALTTTLFVTAFQFVLVNRWRSRSGIKYPQLYASKEEEAKSRDAVIFNCAQRAHQNTLELLNAVTVSTLLVGLKYPVFAAAACGIFTLGRISYTLGYITGDPANRATVLSRAGSFSLLGLIVGATFVYGKALVTGVW